MTYFAEQLMKAVKPNSKFEQTVRIARVTITYNSQEAFEREMARRRKLNTTK